MFVNVESDQDAWNTKYIKEVSVLRRLLFAITHLPEDVHHLWEFEFSLPQRLKYKINHKASYNPS